MTILARRSLGRAVAAYCVLFLAITFILDGALSLAIENPFDSIVEPIFFLVLGAVALIASVPLFIRFYRIPKIIVWYENGVFHFPDFECKSDGIKNIEYKTNKINLDGTLTVHTREGSRVYGQVQGVDKAYFDMALLILKSEGYINE